MSQPAEIEQIPEADQVAMLERVDVGETFAERLTSLDEWPLCARVVETLQLNLGRFCPLQCKHCHVNAGPNRIEMMSRETIDACVEAAARHPFKVIDITGGAPETHPDFRHLVTRLSDGDAAVYIRSNLVVLAMEGLDDLPEFLADCAVELFCSLPSTQEKQTDTMRGDGVFGASLKMLRRLNELGFGAPDSDLRLHLVANPVGAFLPASQASLECEWKERLADKHDVTFDSLISITNMPINRYLQFLLKSGNLESYMRRLSDAYNPATIENVMCRSLISVDWRGRLYDCDFNQTLELPTEDAPVIGDVDFAALEGRRIVTGPHCFGCAAGGGSSCTGEVTTAIDD